MEQRILVACAQHSRGKKERGEVAEGVVRTIDKLSLSLNRTVESIDLGDGT
jgi:hypothetical protein